MRIHKQLEAIEAEIYAAYRYIHENPELGLNEYNTVRFIKEEIEKLQGGITLINIGETGLVAVLKGEKEGAGPNLLLRADMDALPIHEDAAHDPRSSNDSVMHACGHDAHTAMLLGAVKILHTYRAYFSGAIYFFFQPGEEIMAGAKLLLESNAVDLNTIDGVAACHVMPDLYAGDIGLKSGPVLASADEFEITVTGSGGHGAHPYTTVDPVMTALNIGMQLQNLVSREVSALDCAVISVCSIHTGGDAFNVIPDCVYMKGTLRAVEKETRQRLKNRIAEVCKYTAQAGRAQAEVVFKEGPPPLCNTPDWAERTKKACGALLGDEHIKTLDIATMGAEDFAFLMDRYPGVFVRIGCRGAGEDFTPIHSGKFIVDRKALPIGTLTYCAIALDFLKVEKAVYS